MNQDERNAVNEASLAEASARHTAELLVQQARNLPSMKAMAEREARSREIMRPDEESHQ
jgi:hypothetical protein